MTSAHHTPVHLIVTTLPEDQLLKIIESGPIWIWDEIAEIGHLRENPAQSITTFSASAQMDRSEIIYQQLASIRDHFYDWPSIIVYSEPPSELAMDELALVLQAPVVLRQESDRQIIERE